MTPFCCLPGSVPGEFAARYFSRPRLANLYGLLRRTVRVAGMEDPASRVPPFVERLWMPAYAIRIQAATRKGTNSVWTSVDGWSGQCAIMDCADQLVMRDLDEDCLPPKLEEPEAIEAARKGLLRFILSQRGQMDKPDIGAVEEIRLYHFPLWVYYHHRRFGTRLDIKALDGCTGKSAGAKMRIAVINALVAAKKSKARPS